MDNKKIKEKNIGKYLCDLLGCMYVWCCCYVWYVLIFFVVVKGSIGNIIQEHSIYNNKLKHLYFFLCPKWIFANYFLIFVGFYFIKRFFSGVVFIIPPTSTRSVGVISKPARLNTALLLIFNGTMEFIFRTNTFHEKKCLNKSLG